jgi:muramoyltetrapeptide carboxypeptidase
MLVRPPALHPGSRIALISPAGPSKPDRLERAVARCRELGVDAVRGRNVLARNGYLAGDDAMRLADFAAAVDDPSIDAIWSLRGGYGTMRLLDRLDLSAMRERPKAFIGFSDNTAVHLALARLGVVSFHGAHAGAEYGEFTTACLRRVVFEADAAAELPMPRGACAQRLSPGTAEASLTGGNLSLLAASCGTPFQLDARDRIVFIEDINEPAYRVDRAFTQLRLAGCLDGVRGFAFGAFSWDNPEADDQPPSHELLARLIEPFGVPALAGLPFGHIDEQWCLPLGVRARLGADEGTLSLLEPATRRNA